MISAVSRFVMFAENILRFVMFAARCFRFVTSATEIICSFRNPRGVIRAQIVPPKTLGEVLLWGARGAHIGETLLAGLREVGAGDLHQGDTGENQIRRLWRQLAWCR